MHTKQQKATDREGTSVDKDPFITKGQELLKGEIGVQTWRENQQQKEFEAYTILKMKTASANSKPSSTTY